MSNAKRKRTMFISIGVAAVALAAAALIYFLFFKNNNTSYHEKATSTYAEIKTDSRLPDKEYSNLDFSNTVLNIPNVDKLYKIRFSNENSYTPEECTKNCYEMFDIAFGFLREENPDITFTDWDERKPLADGEAYYITYPDGSVYEAGIDYFISNDSIDYYESRFPIDGRFIIYDTQSLVKKNTGDLKEVIHLDRGEDVPNEGYIVDGKEYSPAQALEFADNVMNGKITNYLSHDKFSPTELVILQNPESGDCFYTIQFEYVYEGIPYFHLSLPKSIETDKYNQYGVIYITITSPDRIAEIYNMMNYAKVDDIDELKDKYIPLLDAIDMVNEYLAPYFKQEISEVTIKYVNVIKNPVSNALDFDNEEEYQKWLQSDEKKNYDEEILTLRPYWCFIIDKKDPLSEDYCLSAEAILVDMQTGEIVSYIEINN